MSFRPSAGVTVTKSVEVDGVQQQALLLADGETGRRQGAAVECAQVAQGVGRTACHQENCTLTVGPRAVGKLVSTTFVLKCDSCLAQNMNGFSVATGSLEHQVEKLTFEQRPDEI